VNFAVRYAMCILPLIVEPFSISKGRPVPARGHTVPKWYPDETQDSHTDKIPATSCSILEHFHPFDYRTAEAQAVNAQRIFEEVASGIRSGLSAGVLAYTYSRSKVGLPQYIQKGVQGDPKDNVETRVWDIFSRLDCDGSGSLDLSERHRV